MESLKHYEENRTLRTLSDLKKRVDSEAARYLPDFTYGASTADAITFDVAPIAEMFDDPAEPDTVGLKINIPGTSDEMEHYYLTTDWSRHQLLQLVGAKERWFDSVSLERQAEELNARRHVLHNCMFRTMTANTVLPIRTIRGLVSSRYSDYPNTSIMGDLIQVCPADSTYSIRDYSGITEKCFYCAVVIDEPMGLPGFSEGYPGVIVKNSEVGYTSLWVVPFLYLPTINRMAAFEKRTYLRRVHRGSMGSVEEDVKKSLEDASALWKGLQPKLQKLQQIRYADEDEAVVAIRAMLVRLKTTKHFQLSCVQAYRRAKHSVHNALTLFESVCLSTSTLNQDTAYDAGAIAGALLLTLTEKL